MAPAILNSYIYKFLKTFSRSLKSRDRNVLVAFEVFETRDIYSNIRPTRGDRVVPRFCVVIDVRFVCIGKHQIIGNLCYFANSKRVNVAYAVQACIYDVASCRFKVRGSVSSGSKEVLKILEAMDVKIDESGVLQYKVNGHGYVNHIFDPPWMMRQLKDQFQEENISYYMNGSRRQASENSFSSLLNHLPIHELFKNSVSTSAAAKTFSYTSYSLMVSGVNFIAASTNEYFEDLMDTSLLFRFFDLLFDSTNATNTEPNAAKLLRLPYNKTSLHKTFWLEAMDVLKRMKFTPLIRAGMNVTEQKSDTENDSSDVNPNGDVTLREILGLSSPVQNEITALSQEMEQYNEKLHGVLDTEKCVFDDLEEDFALATLTHKLEETLNSAINNKNNSPTKDYKELVDLLKELVELAKHLQEVKLRGLSPTKVSEAISNTLNPIEKALRESTEAVKTKNIIELLEDTFCNLSFNSLMKNKNKPPAYPTPDENEIYYEPNFFGQFASRSYSFPEKIGDFSLFQMWIVAINSIRQLCELLVEEGAVCVCTRYFNCDDIVDTVQCIKMRNESNSVVERIVEITGLQVPDKDNNLTFVAFTEVGNFTLH